MRSTSMLVNAYRHAINQSLHVDRADKTAPLPEPGKGMALQGMNASGGTSQGLAQGPDRGQGGRSSKN